MGNSGAKLVIDKEMMTMELNLENNYKDKAYEAYLNVKAMIESFYEQKEISIFTYKSYKKKMKKYDNIYEKTENT